MERIESGSRPPRRAGARSGRSGLRLVLVVALAALVFGAGFAWSDRSWPQHERMRAVLDRVRAALRGEANTAARPPGRWRAAPQDSGAPEVDPDEAQAALESLGYLSGYEAPSGTAGVTLHAEGVAWPGLNLWISGHAPVARLMDMDGRTVHEWSYGFERAFPDSDVPRDAQFAQYWRRVHLFPNGDLLALFVNIGLVKLDRDSNLAWTIERDVHHDLDVTDDGSIFVLTRKAHVVPRIHAELPILEDYVSVYDRDGNELRHVSILSAFEDSSYASHLAKMSEHGDILHSNTLEVLDGRHADVHPAFRKGNVLISVLKTDTIAIVDMEAERVVWALSGQWEAQHQPTFVDDGRLLLLDNQGHRGMSKVIELDPLTQEIVWAYEGTPANGFFTYSCGSCQRLPNGNTLITESDSGRAFEVDSERRIVWEFRNPERGGANGELVATLFEVVRVGEPMLAREVIERVSRRRTRCSRRSDGSEAPRCALISMSCMGAADRVATSG